MAETCKSCGKAWTDHLGVEPTCALLQEAVKILEEFLGDDLEGPVYSSESYGDSCYYCMPTTDWKHERDCPNAKAKEFIAKIKIFASASENQANATL